MIPESHPVPAAALAAAGPVVAGGVLALRLGDAAPALALPAIVFGVTAVTVPALYVATAATGSAPPAARMAAAVARALVAIGVALLGFAAPLAFLVATSLSPDGWMTMGALALGGSLLLGLAALHRGLFDGQGASLVRDGVFATWAVVALVIGARLYLDLAVEVSA